jgi:hypothetical protein
VVNAFGETLADSRGASSCRSGAATRAEASNDGSDGAFVIEIGRHLDGGITAASWPHASCAEACASGGRQERR